MRAGVLMVLGSAVFALGAAIAVPRVFTEPDPEARLRMVEPRLFWWRLGQPLYAGGALLAALGVGSLAAESAGASATWLWVSSALLVVGAAFWSWSTYLRAQRHRDFARGRLPGWPFAAYCWLTFAGLALLGVGLLHVGPDWLGWVVLGTDVLFTLVYVRYGDIPPFVFYLVLCLVGLVVW